MKVTEDHSLLNEKYELLKPIECNKTTKLLTSYPSKFNIITSMISMKEAFEYGFNYTKSIPTEILNGTIEIAHSFLDGYINSYVDVYCYTQQFNAGIYYLMHKIGYIYKKNNKIKDLEELSADDLEELSADDFVYDLETECGRFQAGVGNIIVKNTDSIMIKFKFNREHYVKNRIDTFKLATICGNNLTNIIFKRPPIEMEFEKVFQPFILLTKKRYIANKYENMKDPFDLKGIDSKGTAVVRRDFCNMVKNCFKEIMSCMLNSTVYEQSINESIAIYKSYVEKIDNYNIDIEDLVLSKLLSKSYTCSLCKTKSDWNNLKCIKCHFISPPGTIQCKKCNYNFTSSFICDFVQNFS